MPEEKIEEGGGKEAKKETEEQKEEAEKEEKKKEEEEAGRGNEKISDVNTMLLWFIDVLSYNTWMYLGLVPNPVTKKVQKDLNQAKKAIDCVRFLLEQVETAPEERARLQNLLTDLQMNFVEKSRE